MYKRLTIVLVAVALVTGCGFKNRKGYFYDNHRFNYVKVEKFAKAKGRDINHPYQFTEPQMSTILKLVQIKKGVFYSKDEKIKEVFDSYSIGKLTEPIVRGFSELKPDQKLAFSFLVKAPKIILRDDRLTNGWMWVEDGKLHIEFADFYVKVTGDIDKRGYTALRQAQSARGLEVSLDIQAGQEYGSSTKELVIDPGTFTKIAEERVQKEAELAKMGVKDTVRIEVVRDKSVNQRLKELDTLKKQRMLTEEEYQKKRQEILNGL